MGDFFEIDFLDVEAKKSGDAITIRYKTNDVTYIHVVDGGYQDTGQKVVDCINRYYDAPTLIDHLVATHPDGDHIGGLRTVLEEFDIGRLWMLRPWALSEQMGLSRGVAFRSLRRCVIPSVISTARPR